MTLKTPILRRFANAAQLFFLDVGFRKSYAEKIKSDPIWLIYTRAYKQHYARFMKKTMSKNEFAQWAEYALDLRQKTLDGEIGIKEYTELIRKGA